MKRLKTLKLKIIKYALFLIGNYRKYSLLRPQKTKQILIFEKDTTQVYTI